MEPLTNTKVETTSHWMSANDNEVTLGHYSWTVRVSARTELRKGGFVWSRMTMRTRSLVVVGVRMILFRPIVVPEPIEAQEPEVHASMRNAATRWPRVISSASSILLNVDESGNV